MNEFDISLVDWSRAQFALTAIYHWLFVPLTLGLSFIVAIMESIYAKTANEEWKKTTKFWMKLFGINFAIGVSTGIILEFEFGTNWANYSWIVGDIFGAPLAIEGIFAFFLESTFIAVMFFGWDKVSKRFHLVSSWLVAIGSNLSALWILVANGWMQNPVGMEFNADMARNEMANFWEVLFNPMAVHKFLHTVSSGYIVASLFVCGISSWYILKKRNVLLARRSIIIATTFGLTASIYSALTGDSSAKTIYDKQAMKFAAMEGLYEGKENAELIAFGILNPEKKHSDSSNVFIMQIPIPSMLSILATGNSKSFVPGINDIINGNDKHSIESANDKIMRGRIVIENLKKYKEEKDKNPLSADSSLSIVKNGYKEIGYGYFSDKDLLIPNVPIVFYSFHFMVILGFYFIALFSTILYLELKNKLSDFKIILKISLWSIPLGYIASELGWVLAEVGRQPWTIQNILPTFASTSHISTNSVITTFFLFLTLFTFLLIAEIRIMLNQIRKGPEGGENA